MVQIADHHGLVHKALIEFEQLMQPLIPEFFSGCIQSTIKISLSTARDSGGSRQLFGHPVFSLH